MSTMQMQPTHTRTLLQATMLGFVCGFATVALMWLF